MISDPQLLYSMEKKRSSGSGLEDRPRTPESCILVGLGRATSSLAQAIGAEGVQVITVAHPTEALEMARKVLPDLILVGPDMENPGPARFIGLLREAVPAIKVLALLDSADPDPAHHVVLAGADDVVTPPHSLSNVLLRASLALSKGRPRARTATPAPAEATMVDNGSFVLEVEDEERALVLGGQRIQLAPRELELLQHLDSARGSVVSRETLLAEIWGKGADDDAVLDATVHRLRRKIDSVAPGDELLVTVRGVGYRLEAAVEHQGAPQEAVSAGGTGQPV